MALSGYLSGNLSTDFNNPGGGGGGYSGTLTDGLYFYYAQNGIDQTGSEPDLVPFNGPWMSDGKVSADCMIYDGVDQYHSMTGGNLLTALEPGDGDRSYSMWVYNEPDAASKMLWERGTGVSAIQLYIQSSDELVLYIGFGYTVGAKLTEGAWNHVGFRRNQSTGDLDLFVNGALTSDNKARASGVAANYLARGFSGPTRYYNGKIDQWCAWDRVLTDAEIAELYSSGNGVKFVPELPLADSTLNTGLVSYYDEDGTDRVGSNNLTANNTPGTAQGKVTPLCMDLTRVNSEYFSLADASAGDFEPNQIMALSMWFRPDALTSFPCLWSKGTGAEFRAYIESLGQLTVQWGGSTVVYGAASVAANTWNHLYVEHNDPLNTLKVSLNGAVPTLNGGVFPSSNSTDFQLGTQSSGGAANYWGGRIDQFCVWHRILTDEEQTEIYNGGAGSDWLVP